MTHVNFLSGGVASWAAGKRVAEAHGTANLINLFTDTKTEDEDTYRFLREAAENIGGEFVTIADGRDIWQIFKDKKFLANSRVDVCSAVLKRTLADKWIKERFKPDEVICYTGIDWSEVHRQERMAKRKLPYIYEAPLCEPEYLTKAEIHIWAESEGLRKQRLYKMGLQHANCGGGCIKAGVGHWRQLFKEFPERYLEWEMNELDVYKHVENAKPFLKMTIEGKLEYITLHDLRVRFLEPEQEGAACQIDMFDIGGCGCFNDE